MNKKRFIFGFREQIYQLPITEQQYVDFFSISMIHIKT